MTSERTRVMVAVCTHRRNELLERLLASLEVAAAEAEALADVGVVIVDDNDDGRAEPIATAWNQRFALGVTYRRSGKGNISIARNLAMDTATALGERTAMTDDDCEVVPGWLLAHLQVAERTGADATTGPLRLSVPAGSPQWLTAQPFLGDGQFDHTDGAEMETAATNNSMIRSAFWIEHPEVRFRDDLGVVGGEDMVFYRTARRAGLRIRYAADAAVTGNETPDRTTFGAVMRSRLWLGNTEAVTNLTVGDATPGRLVLRAAKRTLLAVAHPLRQIAAGRPPQLRYTLGLLCRATGMTLGAAGVRLRHH